MKYELREKEKSIKILERIKRINLNRKINLMVVCGTHTQTVVKFGLRSLLPSNIKIIDGPGCPVCVCPAADIDLAIRLSLKKDVILTTFGDMFRTPGSRKSLADAKSEGANVEVVYGIDESTKLARKKLEKEIVHFAIGFETTAPSTAVEVLESEDLDNFSIICSHRTIPPAMEALLRSGECKIDGFICAGHVSTIIGSNPYKPIAKEFNRPCIVSGFEPNDVLLAVYMILRQLNRQEAKVENEYKRSVRPEGNLVALKKMWEVFEPCDKGWRGIGVIPKSGLKLRKNFEKFDAEKKFNVKIKNSIDIKPGCKCGEIMKGLAKPSDCPHFKKACTPDHPLGPCAVSIEGTCNVAYRYGE